MIFTSILIVALVFEILTYMIYKEYGEDVAQFWLVISIIIVVVVVIIDFFNLLGGGLFD